MPRNANIKNRKKIRSDERREEKRDGPHQVLHSILLFVLFLFLLQVFTHFVFCDPLSKDILHCH